MVAANHDLTMRRSDAGRGGGIVLALRSYDDPWGVQLVSQVRQDALPKGRSTLVLTDPRWYEHLLGAEADAALLTAIDLEADGPHRVRRLARRTCSGIVAFSAQMEPEGFDVVGCAVERGDRPGRLHSFDWEYFPGTTTREADATAADHTEDEPLRSAHDR